MDRYGRSKNSMKFDVTCDECKKKTNIGFPWKDGTYCIKCWTTAREKEVGIIGGTDLIMEAVYGKKE